MNASKDKVNTINNKEQEELIKININKTNVLENLFFIYNIIITSLFIITTILLVILYLINDKDDNTLSNQPLETVQPPKEDKEETINLNKDLTLLDLVIKLTFINIYMILAHIIQYYNPFDLFNSDNTPTPSPNNLNLINHYRYLNNAIRARLAEKRSLDIVLPNLIAYANNLIELFEMGEITPNQTINYIRQMVFNMRILRGTNNDNSNITAHQEEYLNQLINICEDLINRNENLNNNPSPTPTSTPTPDLNPNIKYIKIIARYFLYLPLVK